MGAAETEWERPAPLFSILWKRAGNRRLPQRRNLLEFRQISQHFGTVLCRVHVEIGFANDAIRIDEKRVARREFRNAEIHQRIVAGGHLMFRVRQQLEAETFLGAKLLVRSFILHADSEDDGVFMLVLREVALEIVRFLRAPAGEILRIEIQNDPLAPEIVEAERFSILRIQSKVRRGRPRRGRFVSRAHRASGSDNNEHKDQSDDDYIHFHFTHSTLVSNPACFQTWPLLSCSEFRFGPACDDTSPGMQRPNTRYSFWLNKPKPRRN